MSDILSSEDSKFIKLNFDSDKDVEAFDLNWKKPPKVADLKADYEAALPVHNNHVANVENWLSLMEAKYKAPVKGRSSIEPKLIRKQAEWRYSALSEPFLSTFNLFDVQPVTYEDTLAAEQNMLVLNHQINNKIDKVKFIDEYVRTAVDEGTAVVKVGWKYETGIRKVEYPIYGMVPVQDPELAQEMMMQGIEPVEEGIVDYELVEEEITIANHPTLEVCEASNVIIDPTCKGSIDDAKFIIHTYVTSLDILKSDDRYKNLDKVEAENGGPLSYSDGAFKDDTAYNFEFKDKARKKLVMHEYWGYWDVEGNGTLTSILACYIGNTLVRLEENPYPDKKLPFIVVQYLPVRKSVYGEPDAVLIEENQKIKGAIIRGMIDLMGRSANAQQAIRKDALDITNQLRFHKGEDYFVNPSVDPEKAIHMHKYPEIPNSALTLIQVQDNEAEAITGVKAYSNGLNGNSLGDTATGVRSTLDATAKREMGILRRLANGIIQIGRKFITLNSEFLEEEEVVRITNEEFVRVKRDNLNGSVDLRLTISTAESDNEKAQELSFMLQTMGNTLPFDMTKLILADIAKLRKMPELAKQIKEYQQQPDPIEEKRRELEIMKLEAEIMALKAKALEDQADAELKQARAGKTSSEKDKLDLDFVEQAEGVKHTRDLDKANTQSKNKIDEEAARRLLDFEEQRALTATMPQPNANI